MGTTTIQLLGTMTFSVALSVFGWLVGERVARKRRRRERGGAEEEEREERRRKREEEEGRSLASRQKLGIWWLAF